MMKDKYEISIWEDYITNPLLGDTHSSECRIATIGSNTMNTPSLIFSLYLHFFTSCNNLSMTSPF